MTHLTTTLYADRLTTPNTKGNLIHRDRVLISMNKGKISKIESLSSLKLRLLSKKVARVSLVLPGLIDPHTHIVVGGDRVADWKLRLSGATYQELVKSGGGIKCSVKLTRDTATENLVNKASERLQQYLCQGFTTVEIKTGYGLSVAEELRLLQVIQKLKLKTKQTLMTTLMAAHADSPEFLNRCDYIKAIKENLLPKSKGLADFQDVFCEQGYFSENETIDLLKEGLRYGLKPKVHAHEFGRTGGVRAAVKVKAISADHLMMMSRSDLLQMKKSGVIPVILPATSFFLKSKNFADARAMRDAGLKVAIGSDFNPGTQPGLNPLFAGTLAAMHSGLTLDEVLVAQTYHAALALDLKDRGLLEKGYRADLACFEARSFEEIYYHYGHSLVTSIYLGGKKSF